MVLASMGVRVDSGAFEDSSAARDVARLARLIDSAGKDPRRGIRVILHLQRVGETPRESFVYRSTPHEMVRVDWPFFLADAAEIVTAVQVRRALEEVVRRVVQLGSVQGFVVDERAVGNSLTGVTSAPPTVRVVDRLTTKCLQVLWTVRHGGGVLDARQVDVQMELRGGNVEGGIMPELKYLKAEGLADSEGEEVVAPKWRILPKGEQVIAEYEQFPSDLSKGAEAHSSLSLGAELPAAERQVVHP